MSPAIVSDYRPSIPADRAVWDAAVAELPPGVRMRAILWRDGSFQVQADLPRRWHRPHSRIDQTAVGTGPTFAAAVGAFRRHLSQIKAELQLPGHTLYREPEWSPGYPGHPRDPRIGPTRCKAAPLSGQDPDGTPSDPGATVPRVR